MIRMTLWSYTTLTDPAPGGSRTPNPQIRSYPALDAVRDKGIDTVKPSETSGVTRCLRRRGRTVQINPHLAAASWRPNHCDSASWVLVTGRSGSA
jgi:hypothetical protein